MELTASKMSRTALARVDSGKRSPRIGRGDFGTLVGVSRVGVSMVGVSRVGGSRVGVSRVGVSRIGVSRVGCAMVGVGGVGVGRVGAGRVGVGVVTGKGTGSCKSGKGESTDDFELHVVVVVVFWL